MKLPGERATILTGVASACIALIVMAFASESWIIFAIMPVFALGGIGTPALQSLATGQVDNSQQGQFQGVLASAVSLASIVSPLAFSSFYFAVRKQWPRRNLAIGRRCLCDRRASGSRLAVWAFAAGLQQGSNVWGRQSLFIEVFLINWSRIRSSLLKIILGVKIKVFRGCVYRSAGKGVAQSARRKFGQSRNPQSTCNTFKGCW